MKFFSVNLPFATCQLKSVPIVDFAFFLELFEEISCLGVFILQDRSLSLLLFAINAVGLGENAIVLCFYIFTSKKVFLVLESIFQRLNI